MSSRRKGRQKAGGKYLSRLRVATLTVVDLGRCPCGREISADREHGAVVHAMPACKKFEQLEPDEFLRYVRRSRGIITDN